jgi:branched-subunit amino acid aminotransferase/4-amino-4-deoxychorismate lyase
VTSDEQYINIDGKLLPADSLLISHTNRSFNYGDGLFESMHAFGTEIQMADEHFTRLFKGMKALRIIWDEDFTKEKITREITHLLNRNKFFKGTRVRLTVYRQTGGLFKPQNNSISYLIETSSLPNDFYQLNDKGLHIDIYREIKKPVNFLAPYKTCNSLTYVLAGIYVSENGLDDCLLVNDAGHIIEGYHSNLFIFKNNVLYTPSLASGCVAGIMRGEINRIASENGIKVNEDVVISEKVLLEADEIFLTNAVEGIRWVQAFKSRRYFNLMAKKINAVLNKTVFKGKY